MKNRIGVIAALSAIGFAALLWGQLRADQVLDGVRITGRVLRSSGLPVAGRRLMFSGINKDPNFVRTDEKGYFVFYGKKRVAYSAYLTLVEKPLQFADLGMVELADGSELAIGDVVIEAETDPKPWIRVVGPITLLRISAPPAAALRAKLIAAIYVLCPSPSPEPANEFCPGGELHIVHGDGSQFQPPLLSGQVGITDPMISENRFAVGWRIDYDNCCTSYPLSLGLGIYVPGKPPLAYKGDGRAIFGWHFVAGGRQVEFCQEYPHGDLRTHYELRSVSTSRLVARWDEGDSEKVPVWANGC
jgi:hypothetical protein